MEEIKKQGMESLFCPYEQALSLKEFTSDIACYNYDFLSVTNSQLDEHGAFCAKDDEGEESFSRWTAPLYQQAFRWFREKYGLYFSIQYFQYDEWCLQITTKKEDTVFNYKSIDGFKTYEEAELACLQKLIEIVKNK